MEGKNMENTETRGVRGLVRFNIADVGILEIKSDAVETLEDCYGKEHVKTAFKIKRDSEKCSIKGPILEVIKGLHEYKNGDPYYSSDVIIERENLREVSREQQEQEKEFEQSLEDTEEEHIVEEQPEQDNEELNKDE